MNRIYQGKVTKVEIHNGKDAAGKTQWKELTKPEWQQILWQHHVLFQDAVNYYTLMLASLAQGCEDAIFQKEYIEEAYKHAADKQKAEAEAEAKARLKALSGWLKQVSDTWEHALRKAIKFDGPNKNISAILGLESSKTDFKDCLQKIAENCKGDTNARLRALITLLNEADKSDLNKVCSERLPFFCSEPEFFHATPKDASQAQRAKSEKFVVKLHEANVDSLWTLAKEINPYLFMTQEPKSDPLGEKETLALALKYFKKVSKGAPQLEALKAQFEAAVKTAAADKPLKHLRHRPTGVFPYAVIFWYLPEPLIWEAFKKKTVGIYKKTKETGIVKDYIYELRRVSSEKNPFTFFTNIALHREPKPTKRAVWWDFDLAAFIEAINPPHRYYEDTKKREEAAQVLRKKIGAMEGTGQHAGTATDDEDEIDALPGFKRDKRIERIRKLVTDTLGYLAEVEDPARIVGGKTEYSISERTLRGFSKIQEKWRKLAAKKMPPAELKAKLKEVLNEEQSAHKNDFGSATLYHQLLEEEFHPIWRDKGTESWHAENPLEAWLQYQDIKRELADKERIIRFTPAHPEYSRRYFDFPKQSALKTVHLQGVSVSGTMSFTSGIVMDTAKRKIPVPVRISYSAPRMRRDNLRIDGNENLSAAPWIQPMMEAIGVPKPDTQNFANTRIALIPLAPDNMQLVFPVKTNTNNLQKYVSKGINWKQQFIWGRDTLTALRWPHEKMKTEPEKPWWELVDSFSCLAVDLGQRDAGAFARLEVSQKAEGVARFIGEAGGHKWYAKVARIGIFRLPGEDARVWRDAAKGETAGFDYREELSGEKGRLATLTECDDTSNMLREFGQNESEFMPANWRGTLSFPEQNDKLLVAARRAQGRVAQLHRWAWFLTDDKKKRTAIEEIAEHDSWLIPEEWKSWAEKNNPKLHSAIKTLIEKEQLKIIGLLVRLANRVLPLRGRSWQWGKNPQKPDCFLLDQSGPAIADVKICGQRGISMERIEQITELRKRLQSLNQTLRRSIGGKPMARRDDSIPDCCPDLLEKLNNIKEQRVNQTAHLIMAESLGLRLVAPSMDKKSRKHSHSQHGKYEKVSEPVSFIVIENLSRYLTSQGRASRENSRLMKWSHRAISKKLKMLCEVFYPSLRVRGSVPPILETPAAYSSRFCSRSGVAGFRAVEVGPGFENNFPWVMLKNKQEDGKATTEAKCVQELITQINKLNKGRFGRPLRTLLAPSAGGPIFVPIVDKVKSADIQPALVQADINAAINLGLRAIADPHIWSIHPRCRTRRQAGKTLIYEKRKFGEKGEALDVQHLSEAKSGDTRNPNFFADVSGSLPAWEAATIGDQRLLSGQCLWSEVKKLQWKRCADINAIRVAAWNKKTAKNIQ